MGHSSVLNKEEEQLLVDWINAYAKKEFPIKRRTLFETVKNIMEADERQNPFANPVIDPVIEGKNMV